MFDLYFKVINRLPTSLVFKLGSTVRDSKTNQPFFFSLKMINSIKNLRLSLDNFKDYF